MPAPITMMSNSFRHSGCLACGWMIFHQNLRCYLGHIPGAAIGLAWDINQGIAMSPYDTTAGTAAIAVSPAIWRAPSGQLILCGLMAMLGLGFGLQYASARLMGLSAVEPMGALLLIHIGLGLLFVAGLVLTGRLFWPTLAQFIFFTAVALLSNVGQLGVELVVGPHVPAGELTLIVSLLPVFVLLLAAVLRSEALTLRKVCGILLGVAASIAILLPRSFEGEAQLFWVALTFAAPVSQALAMVLMARFWPKGLEPLQVATGNLVMGTVLLVPMVLLSGESLGLVNLWSAGGAATALFGLTVAAEFYLVAVLTRRGGAVLASCADFIAVCAGLGFGYVLFAEVPTAWMGIAAALCLLALKLAMDRPAAESPHRRICRGMHLPNCWRGFTLPPKFRRYHGRRHTAFSTRRVSTPHCPHARGDGGEGARSHHRVGSLQHGVADGL